MIHQTYNVIYGLIYIKKKLCQNSIRLSEHPFVVFYLLKLNQSLSYYQILCYGHLHHTILVKKQLEGLKIASNLGFLLKVNCVLIPDINLGHVRDIAYEVHKRGASILNIMPLIPLGKFANMRAPTCEELQSAREKCESIIPIFRACKQCRADACGIPGLEDHMNSQRI